MGEAVASARQQRSSARICAPAFPAAASGAPGTDVAHDRLHTRASARLGAIDANVVLRR